MTRTGQMQLDALSVHLQRRRDALLRDWRESIRRDPELTTNSSLSRSALDDHIPRILEDFERRLRADHELDAAQIDLQQRKDAAEHGMHRWQQGYDIRETVREWGHLQRILLQELDRYATSYPEIETEVIPAARQALVELCTEGICESASRHVQLDRAEAASRVRELEQSLSSLQSLENERATLLHETAHDLRGSVGVIANATALLVKTDVSGSKRDRFYDLLQQRIRTVGALLTDLVDLARLEAGQDPLQIEEFDAARRVRDYCETLRPLAAERNLFLKCEGPKSLVVEGDSLKLQRILQNLLLNALKIATRGGVVVRWAVDASAEARQWTLSIEDTGPGFSPEAAGPLRLGLTRVSDDARPEPRRAMTPAVHSTDEAPELPSGEGIGLAIVKRLSQLLGASVELETKPGEGTTIRISFPLRYSTAHSMGDR